MALGLKNGSLLDHGKYRIERILGQGGFGITYLVTDLGLDKLRAIKEFFPKDYCDRDETTSHITLGTSNTAEFVDKLKKKFIKEARNIANLDQHQGIITIHAVFEENNTAYYVMDYIEGSNLSEVVKKDGSLPVDKAIKYITEVGNALEYMHKHRINHLDIKPANIMIRRLDDSPILIDFGLSKQYDSEGLQTSTTPTGISHGYAPFEQYNDAGIKEFSPQTDVYSLAATLYYLVSGKVPPNSTDLIENELSFPEGFPYFMKEPISKAMSLKRQGRHETIKEFIKSLESKYEVTVIEVPTAKFDDFISVNNRKEKVFEPKNHNEKLLFADIQERNSIVSKENSNSKKKGERRKNNFITYLNKHKNTIIGLCLGIGLIGGGIIIAVFSKKNVQEENQEENPLGVPEENIDKINGFKVKWSDDITKSQKYTIKALLNNMIYVPGGKCKVISINYTGEKNEKLISTESFWIDKFEITQSEWETIMQYNPAHFNQNNLYPVEMVSWRECNEFISKLKYLTGLRFSLPTEDEWIYAAVSGKDYIFGGKEGDPLSDDSYNWNASNSGKHSNAVGKKLKNDLGIYDMIGNVWEWTSTKFNNNVSPEGEELYIRKGGSFMTEPDYNVLSKVGDYENHKAHHLGFRVVIY